MRKAWRPRGVAEELMRRLLDALAAEKVITIFAEPDADAFYRRHGFAGTAGGMLLRRS